MNCSLAQAIIDTHAATLQTGDPLPLSACTRPEDSAHGDVVANVRHASMSSPTLK
jgi:hypothetical protein